VYHIRYSSAHPQNGPLIVEPRMVRGAGLGGKKDGGVRVLRIGAGAVVSGRFPAGHERQEEPFAERDAVVIERK
jgi:hypothetical protein